jgi:P-type Cu+ transporter
MNFATVAVVTGALGLAGFLAWFFFGPKRAYRAELVDGTQELVVTVKGGLHARPDPSPRGRPAPACL